MVKVFRIIGTVLLLAAMMIAPAHSAMASLTSAPMMEMADGSPCPLKDCAKMPDCPMALPGGLGLFAVTTPDVSVRLLPEMSSDVFVVTVLPPVTPIKSDEPRRPPKI